MGKDIKDVAVVVQARLGSQRVPGKMIRPFAGTTLVDILFSKLKQSSIIPLDNIYFSAYEEDLKEVAFRHGINIFHRSEGSSMSEGEDLTEMYEWWNKIPAKYVVLISACNPLLKVETIDSFYKSFLESSREGAFAVFEKKTYYWNKEGDMITPWIKDYQLMNTKYVEPVYEAAHTLYASKMEWIKDGYWLDNKLPPQPELVTMDELEAFDIDYEWQFQLGEKLYKQYAQ